MENIRIKTVSETKFDEVILSAGGSRILAEGSADYVLNEAVIELKLIQEEGFEKVDRRRKLADLFRRTQPHRPVVLIEPNRLNPDDSRNYYRLVEVPIKNACKKASKQLQATAARFNPPPVRVLVILNVGYTLISPDEFKDVCFKCVRNDTSGIDWVVCGGIYFYSDMFDNYVISRFEDIPINLQRRFRSCNILAAAWGHFQEQMMTGVVRTPESFKDGRMPIIDLVFELDGIRYVKPAPQSPESTFWPSGRRPRENSSGIHSCPPVARTFPSLSEHEWRHFKLAMPSLDRLKSTYREWRDSYPNEVACECEPLKPIVLVKVTFDAFSCWIKKPQERWQFADIGNFSSELLHQQVMRILENAKDKEQTMVVPPDYVHLIVNEIGNDKANDYASIYFVSEIPGFERTEPIVENAKIFWEHGICLASAYAVKRSLFSVLYTKRRIG